MFRIRPVKAIFRFSVVSETMTPSATEGLYDGGYSGEAVQAKSGVDTGTVVFARPWASVEWVVGSGVLLRVSCWSIREMR